jgi:1,4-dihydroxy-2-naphthoate octaprenyltransferase
MGKLVQHLASARLWIFPVPLSVVILGSCLAYKDTGTFQSSLLILQLICLTAAFALTNLLNTYFDFVNDVDGPDSDDQTLVKKVLAPDEVLHSSGVALLVSITSFVLILLLTPVPTWHILPLFVAGISSGVLYTAGVQLKYHALGDATVFIACGMVSVLFTYLGQGGHLWSSPSILFYSLPLGLNITGALHCNNTRDAEADSRKGLLTVAILLGKRGSYLYFLFLIFGSFLLFVQIALARSLWCLLPMLTIWSAMDCERNYFSGSFENLVQKVAQLNLLQTILYVTASLLH